MGQVKSEIFQQSLLALSGGLVRSKILLQYMTTQQQSYQVRIWPQPPPAEPKALFKDMGWHDVTLSRDTLTNHHNIWKHGFA